MRLKVVPLEKIVITFLKLFISFFNFKNIANNKMLSFETSSKHLSVSDCFADENVYFLQVYDIKLSK